MVDPIIIHVAEVEEGDVAMGHGRREAEALEGRITTSSGKEISNLPYHPLHFRFP